MKARICTALLALFLFFPVTGFALPLIDAEIAVGGWMNSPEGDAGYRGDALSLEDDLGYDDETDLTGRIRLELPLLLPNVTFMTTNLSYDGTGNVDFDFDFGDTDFKAGAEFYSEIKLDHHDFAVSFSLPLLELASLGKLQADLGVNLRLLDLEARIEQDQNNLKESKDITLPIPMGYAYVRIEPLDGLAFEAEGRGLVLGDNSMTSVIGRARYNVFGPLFVAGGYRIEKIDIDEEGVKIDTEFKGPFFEAGFKF